MCSDYSTIGYNLYYLIYNWPQLAITTFLLVLPDCDPTASIFLTTSNPSTTEPKTTCLPSSLQMNTLPLLSAEEQVDRSFWNTITVLLTLQYSSDVLTGFPHWVGTESRLLYPANKKMTVFHQMLMCSNYHICNTCILCIYFWLLVNTSTKHSSYSHS